MIVTVTMDEREDPYIYDHPYQLFALSKHMTSTLVRLAGESKIEIEEPVCLYESPVYRFRECAALSFLEKNLFRYNAGIFESKQDAIHIRGKRRWRRREPSAG